MARETQASKGQTGTRTLRWVLLGAGALLVVVVAGFMIAAQRKMHNYLTGLPKRLGVDIQQETNGFTYSQSKGKRKIFTVHASKEVQRSGGMIGMHDVGIVLFGPTGEATDRIHGTDFEYDQKAQTLRAQGEVYIDLVPPARAGDETKGAKPEDPEARMVHVKTMGLVFDQNGERASSDGAVEFRTAGYSGNAVGASYDGESGVLVLRSAVRMSGLRASGGGGERPVVLTASRAQMDRQTNLVDLVGAKYSSAGDVAAESLSANHALVHTTADGTPQRIDAEGDVTLTSEGARRARVVSNWMEVELGARGQAQAAHLFGDVRYNGEDKLKREKGHAEDARIAFDAEGRPVHAAFNGAGGGGVTFVEQGPGSENTVDAGTLELALGGGGKAPTLVKSAEAFGPTGARMRLVAEDAKGRRSTDVRADRLVGRFAPVGRTSELAGMDGKGHSWVERTALNPAGAMMSKDTSTGETLHLDFKPGDGGRSELTRAEQRGGVATVHEVAGKQGKDEVEHGRAEVAVYEAAADLVHLNGGVEIQDETSALFADRVDFDRGSGDATANGSVRVTYLSAPGAGAKEQAGAKGQAGQEPVHVLAVRAVAHKGSGLAEFFGDAGAKARMWQGGSQVEAPVIDLYRKEKRLVAKGTEAGQVRALLVGASSSGMGGSKKNGASGPMRVVSREMVYTDAARTLEFTGGVRAVDADGTLTSNEATVWLTRSDAASGLETKAGDVGFMGGKVDHMLANGGVVLAQPGRTGTGDKLVYTASDGVYVLTGTKAAPPRVVDEAQGTTTGAALRFKSGDDSVEVVGGASGAEAKAGRVHSETRMKQ